MQANQQVALGSRYPAAAPDSGRSMSAIPKYVLYGDSAERGETWLLNVEPLADRCKERGWKIDLHRHPSFAQMVLVRSGRGTISVEDRTIPFQSPCIMMVPLQCVHGFDYEEDSDGWVLTVADHYLNKINARLPEFETLWSDPRVVGLARDSDETAELRRTVIKLERELKLKAVGHFLAAEAHLTSICLSVLRRSHLFAQKAHHLSSNQVKLVQEFRRLIEEHYREGWRIGDFSAALGVTLSRLRSACEQVCGETPIKMIHSRRMTEAKRTLMFTDMSIEQIAYWLGFSSTAYFARFFKTETDLPPAQYRRIARSEKVA
jgi:AraC family transcriptional regulator, transcriptional activator of pobA